MDSGKEFTIRKDGACMVSNLPNMTKIRLFQVTIQPILLYGSETWTLSSKQQKRLDGTYTCLLRRIQDISWRQHKTIKEIYAGLPRVSVVVCKRRLRFAGHCYRASTEAVSPLVLWKPTSTSGRRSRKLSYPDVISRDSGIEVSELGIAMGDKPKWRSIVESISAEAAG